MRYDRARAADRPALAERGLGVIDGRMPPNPSLPHRRGPRRRSGPMSTDARVNRRQFLKVSGVAAVATGLEGVLRARRAPAYAQGTKLHILRWVDFIPEADVELKRQAPEASKALGAEINFEFINANDLQARITAAIQSGSGADI